MTEAATRNGRAKPKTGERGFSSEADDLFSSGRFPYETDEPKPKDYDEMFDDDSQAHALERAVALPILDTPLEIEAAEGGGKEAEFVREVLLKAPSEGGMTTPIENIVSQMVGAFSRKLAFFEIVWEVRDGKYVIKKLAHRPAQTCKIVRDKHGGFDGFVQEGYKNGANVKEKFGIGKAFVYVHRGGEKPLEGRSSFASVYKRYKHKKRVEWLFFDNLQTFTRGIRKATYGGDGGVEGAKALFERVKKVEGAGTVIIGKDDDLEVLRAPGVSAEYKEALNYLDSQMARALQAQWLNLGQDGKGGSYALTRDHSDFFLLGEEAARYEIAWHFTNYLVSLIVRYNFGETGKIPRAVFPPLSENARNQALEIGRELMGKGQLTLKPGLLSAIEEKMAQALDIDAEKFKEDQGPKGTPEAPTSDSPAPEGLQRAIGALQQIAGSNVVPIRQEEELDEDEVLALAEEFGLEPEDVAELHLRTSTRNGSHNEKTHGSWGPHNPFHGKRAPDLVKGTDAGNKVAQRGDTSSGRGGAAFEDNRSADRWGRDNWAEANKGLSSESRDALGNYSGRGYDRTNRYLRGHLPNTISDSNQIRERVDEMDKALAANPLPEDVEALRAVNRDAFGGLDLDDLEGKTFQDSGFMSTALKTKPPRDFASKDVVMRLKVPKGTPAYYMPTITKEARLRSEQELLLGRNRKFRVTGSSYNPRTGKYTVDAEVLP